jgi:hypothetical protein
VHGATRGFLGPADVARAQALADQRFDGDMQPDHGHEGEMIQGEHEVGCGKFRGAQSAHEQDEHREAEHVQEKLGPAGHAEAHEPGEQRAVGPPPRSHAEARLVAPGEDQDDEEQGRHAPGRYRGDASADDAQAGKPQTPLMSA